MLINLTRRLKLTRPVYEQESILVPKRVNRPFRAIEVNTLQDMAP